MAEATATPLGSSLLSQRPEGMGHTFRCQYKMPGCHATAPENNLRVVTLFLLTAMESRKLLHPGAILEMTREKLLECEETALSETLSRSHIYSEEMILNPRRLQSMRMGL